MKTQFFTNARFQNFQIFKFDGLPGAGQNLAQFSPRKVGIVIWLTLNCGLLVGTWLQCMGIPPTCKVYLMGFSNRCITTCLNVLKLITLERHTLGFGKNGGLWMTLPFPGPLFYQVSLLLKERMFPKYRTTTLVASLLLSNHWTFLGVSFFIFFRRKGVGCTLMHNTPPPMFSNKLGLLLLRLGWRPGKPSIPLGGVMFIDCCNQICQPKCQTCVLIPVGLGSKKGFHGTIYSYQMLVDANNFSFHVQFHQKRIMKI